MLLIQSASKDSAEILDAISRLLQLLFSALGVRWTISIIVLIILLLIGWRLYNDWRKDKDTNLALKEKDRTIQRLASMERTWRVLFFKEKYGWTDEQIEKFFLKNEPEDVISARKLLEEASEDKQEKSTPVPKQKGKTKK